MRGFALLMAALLAPLGGGCFNNATIHTDQFALWVQEAPEAGARADSQYVEVAGVKVIGIPDRTLVVVFASGRRERLGTAEEPPRTENAIGAVLMSPRFIEPVHRLPSLLAADIHGQRRPDSTDALRAGWAMIANDRVAVRGQWKGWRFAGWLRLSDDEWLTLFDALRHAGIPPAASSQPVTAGGFRQ